MKAAAVVDTTLPYKNVQAAVRMFAEKAGNARLVKLQEKDGCNGSSMHDAREELARARTQLADERKQKASILSELNSLKKVMECCSCESSLPNGGDLTGELGEGKQQHAKLVTELQELKTQSNKLEQELSLALQEKEQAQRQAEEALATAEMNAKRAEELSQEIAGTKESLLLVKMACIETNKEREALWAARKTENGGHGHMGCSANKSNKPEHILSFDKIDFPKADWRLVRQCLVSAREALENIDRLRAACGSPGSDTTIALELEVVKSEVCKALERDLVLEMSLKDLQHRFAEAKQELDGARFELVELKSRETATDQEIVKLMSELKKVKSELKDAVSCNEAFVGFSQRLRQESLGDAEELACKSIDDAKAELHALLEEEVQAVRRAELQKISQVAFMDENKDSRLEAVFEDNGVVPSACEASLLSEDLHREPSASAFKFQMRHSFKEEHRKKKFSLPLFSILSSKSKRSNRKEMDGP